MKSSSYRKGLKDAKILLKTGLSLWFVQSQILSMGMRPKSRKYSKKNLYLYCKGLNAGIQQAMKRKGVKYAEDHVADFRVTIPNKE